MAGSMKDALEKSGISTPEAPVAPKPQSKKWANELPEHDTAHVPFEAPALTKPKGSSSSVPKGVKRPGSDQED